MNSIDIFLNALNEAASVDPSAVLKLIEQRVSCNQEMIDHPIIMVDESFKVGLVGILQMVVEKMAPGMVLVANIENNDLKVLFSLQDRRDFLQEEEE